MKKYVLKPHEKMLLALLEASLNEKHPNETLFQSVSDKDWQQCYVMAARQGVMALAWDAVMLLPKALQPPLSVKLTWATSVEAYEKKYQRYCQTALDLSEYYKEHGIFTMLLKGVGLSTLYPIPCHREGGDIDIYTYSADKIKMSDAQANALADSLIQQQGIAVETEYYKHSNFYYKGIPIENHKTFLNVNAYHVAGLAEQILKGNMQPQVAAMAGGEVLIPSPDFNTLFVAFHAMQHYAYGLSLHHLCDWAILIRRYGFRIPEALKKEKLYEGMAAMTNLCHRYLGTSVTVAGGDKVEEEMLQEIIDPKYSRNVHARNKFGIIVYKIRRMLYQHNIHKKVLSASLFMRVWDSIIFHIRHPRTIFG